MVEHRELAFNNISKSLAVTKYDIEHRQSINDYGLNIHSENFWRDVLNFVYNCNLENANYENQNMAYVDLIDKSKTLYLQVTTTRTKEKIENSLQILDNPQYKKYNIKILYLLEKSKPNNLTIKELNSKYKIDLNNCLYDSSDLIREINNLETNKLIELNNRYFKGLLNNYAELEILDLVIKHLIKGKRRVKVNYNDEDFGSISSNEKLDLNNINQRISANINSGLDYRVLLDKLDQEDNTLTNLREFIVDDLYKTILENKLLSKVRREELKNKHLLELHTLATEHNLNFNIIINNLYEQIKSNIEIDDFNSTDISWIIISFFFEICDVGVKE